MITLGMPLPVENQRNTLGYPLHEEGQPLAARYNITKEHPPMNNRPGSRITARRFIPALIFVVSAALPAGLWAADPAPATEDLFLNRVPPVLSATRLKQPLAEAPASITVIDRKMIDASGAIDIPELFRLVPGMQVGQKNNSRTFVTYHGLGEVYARRMQVLVDGRSIYSPFFGGVDWGDLPLAIEDIDRIEVIRGPNGPAYGANSFSAVINIITRHPTQDQGTDLKITHGSRGTERLFVRHGASLGDFTYRVTLGYREDNGFSGFRDGKRIPLITFRGEQRINSRDTLDIQGGWTGGTFEDGIQNSLIDPARERDTSSHYQQLRWRRTLNATDEVTLNVYHNYYRWTDSYQTGLLSQLLGTAPANIPILFGGRPDQTLNISEDIRTERLNVELQHTFQAGAGKRVVWGTEARLDRVRGQAWFGNNDWIDTRLYRLFSNLEWRYAPDWILNAGLMYEHNTITEGDFSPRLALNHHFAQGQTARISYTRAHRTPTVFENAANNAYRFPDGYLINQIFLARYPLQPEQISSAEIGYLGEFPEAHLLVDAKIFREEVRRYIADTRYLPTTDVYQYFVNDGGTDSNGAEVQLRWRPGTRTQLIYTHGYAHQRGHLISNSNPASVSSTTDFTPVHTRSLLAIQELPGNVTASAAYYKLSNFRFGGGGDLTGDFNTLDARLAWKWRQNGARGEIALVGQHLTGDYYTFSPTAVFDKRFFLNVSLRFN